MKLAEKRLLVASLPLVLAGFVGIGYLFCRPHITVVGNIPKAEMTQIKSAVRNRLLDEALGPPGGRNYKKLPALIDHLHSHQIRRIEFKTECYVRVLFDMKWRGVVGYELRKESMVWKIRVELFR